jgi:hypothetical protein
MPQQVVLVWKVKEIHPGHVNREILIFNFFDIDLY